MPKFCFNCGNELANDAAFCTKCGTKQEKITAASEKSQVAGKPSVVENVPARKVTPTMPNNSEVGPESISQNVNSREETQQGINQNRTHISNTMNVPQRMLTLEECKKITYAAGVLMIVAVFCNLFGFKIPGLADWSVSIMDISNLLGLYIIVVGGAAVFGTFKNQYGASLAIYLGMFIAVAIGIFDAMSTIGAKDFTKFVKVMGLGAYLLIIGPLAGTVGNVMCCLVESGNRPNPDIFFHEIKELLGKQKTNINGLILPNYVILILVIIILEVISSQVDLNKMGW